MSKQDEFLLEEFPALLDSDDISKEAERYVWFPGDIISPIRKRETRETVGMGITINGGPFMVTRGGGDEYQTPCLRRTKGFVPRAFFTPLEMAATWVPPELVADGADTYRFAGNAPTVAGGVMVGAYGRSVMVGEKVFPGHAATWMLTFARNNGGYSRGLVEIDQLRGQPWESNAASELQNLFFPDYPNVPRVLSALVRQIDQVTTQQSGDIRQIGQQLLSACDEFREWGLFFIAEEHNLVKMGTTKDGWTHRYSDTTHLLMEQLEVTPQDQQFQTVAKMQEEMSRSVMQMMESKGSDQSEMMKMFLASQERIAQAMERLASNGQAAPAADSKQSPPKPRTDGK